MSENTNSGGMSNSTKTIITVLLLLFLPLVGIIMMFVWKLWPVWVRVLITVFYVLVVLGIILATVGLGILVSNSSSSSSYAKLVTTSTSSVSTIADTEFKVGETIENGDKQLTVSKVEDYISDNQFSQPKPGKKFIKATVVLVNRGNSNFSFTAYNFSVQDSNGLLINPDSTTYSLSDGLQSGSLTKNGKVEGSVTFEVPTADKNLVLIFKGSYSSDQTIKVKLN